MSWAPFAVGGTTLARVLAQTKTHGSVAAVGLAGQTLKGQIRGRTVIDVNK